MAPSSAVFASFLLLRDFRNYERLELPLDGGISLFFGQNAAGKTNLLEACCYLSTLTSPRAERDSDLARWGTSAFAVAARAEHEGNPVLVKVETTMTPSPKRKITLNDTPVKRHELHAALPCVYFSPDDLYMVKRGSTLRRKYLDSLLSRVDQAYVREMARYNDAMERRNAVLRRLRWDSSWRKTLESLDDLLVLAGSAVLAKRVSLMERLSTLVEETYAFISGEDCRASYVSSIGPLTPDAGAIGAAFRAALKASAAEERERCITVAGPHRDDILVGRGERTFRYFGSQGQQRSVALALRMAEARTLEEAFGRKPVLLLDDVFSELDEARRHKVLSLCEFGHQILVTSTDPVPEFRREFRMFEVKDNGVRPYGP